MSENILVVEYEPRYTERVRQALSGQPFEARFARDGDEAIRELSSDTRPRLIVLSSVVPKISTTELITTIRGRFPLSETPILLTVSGYNGKSPQEDARRVGATDILPKPYSETDFLAKVHQILGGTASKPAAIVAPDEAAAEKQVKRPAATRATDDVDKMLADTLAGVIPQKKKEAAPPAAQPQPQKPKTAAGTADLDRLVHDTLSGLERRKPATTAPSTAPAAPQPPAPPAVDRGAAAPAAEAKPAPAEPPRPIAPPPPAAAAPSPVPPAAAPASEPIPVADIAKADEEEPVDGIRFGQYVLIEKIATGGMAEVWKARMSGVEGFQKIVAIKKILPHLSDNQEFVEMFIDEAKLAAQLNHSNIIHIYDLGRIQSSYYIAMEYIDGFDLKTILRRAAERSHPMSIELALFVASKIASALDYAHRKKDFESRELGLVHRDVSPQNVLISQEGDIKLCDFGIAKAATKASHTQAGALKGKLQYMAPEQAWGRAIDRRSDVFSLGTVLFEMLTGRKLFGGENELSILDQVREARITAPSLHNDEVGPEIDAIVVKALQKDPADRYQTAGEMARELDAILYSFRPTPTSADLAIYMHHLSSEPAIEQATAPSDSDFAPVVAREPVRPAPVAPAIGAAPVVPAPVEISRAPEISSPEPATLSWEEPPKKSRGLMIGVAAAVLVVIAGGAAVLMMRKPATAQNAAAATSAATVPAAAPVPPPAAADTISGLTETGAELTATDGQAVDPTMVDREVQKLLAAERARLEAQARAQQQAQQTPPAQAQATAPPQTQTTPAERQVTPPPQQAAETPVTNTVAAEQRPAPPPAQQPATETVAPPPAVAESQPAQPATREGDLVPAGTAGLTPPRVIRRGAVPYPSMARAQKVEGTVITSVLVSETGQVLDVRIIRGVNRPVGLNEAAEQAMRRSQFAPGTKDGVRVKAWITVPVEFKL